ncbi:nuclear transport factor 2 family protein [Neorhizobium sp. P12A]|uniref:nuclear transport factor 2 family protein n=1 Tax=Neorhizobium sp. P12A TaxID=2268027 RepID=UPI0011ECE745|nr:nuclear transport factor 2 family protein [Neorhizobium sp. P12A]KAA0700176.1 nuclear transport factor 2 family protein [Neorhizobium sp. P12A]
MFDATELAERYIAIWNETDAGRRRKMIAECWTEDAVYIDPMMKAQGHAEIDGLVAAVHGRFPGFRFSLVKPADRYGDNLRFSWQLGPQHQPDMIMGTDFALLDGDRIKTVNGFIDQLPAEAA